MNLVVCNKDCAHQSDGYCKLENNLYINQYKVDGCCYYQKKRSYTRPQKAKKSADSQ